jgi:hypothetical protein
MANAKQIQKNVNENIRSYELKVVLTPQGINIHQDPRNVTPFEIISILEIIKQTHVAQFNAMLTPSEENEDQPKVVPDIAPFLQDQGE